MLTRTHIVRVIGIFDRAGIIRYWGDAKFATRQKMCNAFPKSVVSKPYTMSC
jgi:hypothetical protein